MKKLVFLTPLFVIGFAVGLGIVLFGAGPAEAGPDYCRGTCIYRLYCSTDTGPSCTNPIRPYYLYRTEGVCLGYPNDPCPDAFVGCCDGDPF
ncbi:MAG: hypothetical protein PHR28_06075 [candidate division Zixibacteria bacterium]|nr:hypothetical protein [candidate division Zixibacteria bacterium]